jgi:anti-sigma B factor antagonist
MNPMTTFQQNERDGDVELVVGGEIDIATSDAFYDQLGRLVAAAHSPAFVDLSGVTFLDSSGLNALVRASRTAETAGVNLVLLAPSRPVRRVLVLSGLAHAFEVRE